MENLQKRGRPKLEEISSLMKEGAQSKSPIRCRFCKRAFPREKSLQAHQRIHTGERPYRCTHPGCHKSFVQSGQLRTHQRLHTGEKPFRCNECKNRFTHANRRCPDHPSAGVIRDEIILTAPTTPPSPILATTTITTPPSNEIGGGISLVSYNRLLNKNNHLHQNLQHNYNQLEKLPRSTPLACNLENNLDYSFGARWERRDEILGALALIELSRCH